MTNTQSLFRSLIVYALCIPLAIYLGYVLTDPLTRSTFIIFSIVLALLCAPFILKYHHHFMLLSWNTTAVLFFIQGRPQLWMAAIALSFGISFTQRILNKDTPTVRVPELTRPLILIVLVVLVTAQLTGGIGMQALGGSVYGGKRYLYMLLAVLGYFALVAQRIPRERLNLCLGLYFLGNCTALIGDLFPVLGNSFPYLFWVIPPYQLRVGELHVGFARLGGITAASTGIFAFMMAKYGIRGIFMSGKPWRVIALLFFTGIGLYGGYRSMLLSCLAIFIVQFFLEGLHRTKLLPALGLSVATLIALALPFASQLPPTVQRSLAFLPLPIDPMVQQSARDSNEWRLNMWKALLPQVPQYLLLGKGLAMTREDLEFATHTALKAQSDEEQGLALSGDYHNGPLSVLISFGIWGMLVWIWFQVASFRVFYRNYRYGDPDLKGVNAFLFASFLVQSGMFWLVVGSFYSGLVAFTGLVGLSVSINGGVARRAPVPALDQARVRNLPTVLPQQRPVFGQ